MAELRQQLASLNVTLLGVEEDLSATDRLDTVASRIFAGLTPPKGTPGQTAPTPPGERVQHRHYHLVLLSGTTLQLTSQYWQAAAAVDASKSSAAAAILVQGDSLQLQLPTPYRYRCSKAANVTCCLCLPPPCAEAAVNVTLFSPPEDCPGWSCVCTDKPDKSRVVAPDNCQAYITCDGRGNGTKSLCTIAGTGFHQETGECKPLDGPPDADNKCNFANGTDGGVAAASVAGGGEC